MPVSIVPHIFSAQWWQYGPSVKLIGKQTCRAALMAPPLCSELTVQSSLLEWRIWYLCEAVRLTRGFPFLVVLPNRFDTFHSFDIFNFDIFDFVASSLENSATYDLVSLARVLPLPHV
jgi:hypothetical protein